MISEINIKNIAIIEEVSLCFGEGLNVLTGETGAGKSILIDSINFVLGGRTSKDIIRAGADEAFVSALFTVENPDNLFKIREMGIDIDSDGGLLLMRSLNTTGRNICRINGRPAAISMLRDVAALLIDIYGQHQSRSLLDAKKHMGLLDRFCGEELKAALEENDKLYTAYRKSVRELKGLSELGRDRETALEILAFQINEIKQAGIRAGEEEELKRKRDFLFNAARIKELAANAANLLYRGEGSAVEKTGGAQNALIMLSRIDDSVSPSIGELEEINDKIQGVVELLMDIEEKAEGSPGELDKCEKRLDLIRDITRKYGGSEEECLKFLAEAEEKEQRLLSSGERAAELSERIKAQKTDIFHACLKISEIRRKYAKRIEGEIEECLHRLGMADAAFKININRRRSFDRLGMDEVEFFIATNGAEELKPLVKIASGGEMSRVMLSVKSVLAACDDIETFIFDEIDTGISGRTAGQVAYKMEALAESRQILCITHLSQICAAGDINFSIEKQSEEGGARTRVTRLDEKGVVLEIARLNGGAEATEAAVKAAEELRAEIKLM